MYEWLRMKDDRAAARAREWLAQEGLLADPPSPDQRLRGLGRRASADSKPGVGAAVGSSQYSDFVGYSTRGRGRSSATDPRTGAVVLLEPGSRGPSTPRGPGPPRPD